MRTVPPPRVSGLKLAFAGDSSATEQNQLLDSLAELPKSGATVVASGTARNLLVEMAGFYLTIRQSMDTALRRWRATKCR
jgi:hypothetical protein